MLRNSRCIRNMQCRDVTTGSCVYVRHKETELIGVVSRVDGDYCNISHALYRFKGNEWQSVQEFYRDYEGEPLDRVRLCSVDYWDVLYDNSPKEIFINVGSVPG